jgi:hypothetical protein
LIQETCNEIKEGLKVQKKNKEEKEEISRLLYRTVVGKRLHYARNHHHRAGVSKNLHQFLGIVFRPLL